MAVRGLGLEDTGRAGSDEDADPIGTVAPRGNGYAIDERVLLETEQCEPVVAAIVVGETGRHHDVVDARNFTDPGVEGDRFEAARSEPAPAMA